MAVPALGLSLHLPPLRTLAQALTALTVVLDLIEERVLDLGDALTHSHGLEKSNSARSIRSIDMSSLQAPAGLQPSASYSFTMRIELRQSPGAFAAVANAIGTRARCSARSISCASTSAA